MLRSVLRPKEISQRRFNQFLLDAVNSSDSAPGKLSNLFVSVLTRSNQSFNLIMKRNFGSSPFELTSLFGDLDTFGLTLANNTALKLGNCSHHGQY
ncbi:Uncharacterised protein [Enterobacter hormaechei]|nr:Uncharacterised protein [Enterobacter hormaechei]VFZ82676.1 Uncharacterised protein [Klebsiella pneumoniae]